MGTDRSYSSESESARPRRAERFVEKYVDSKAKADVLRVLTFRPNQFQSLPEILAMTGSSSAEVERAIFSLRTQGLIQLKEGPRGTVVALAHDSPARKFAPAIWRCLKNTADVSQTASSAGEYNERSTGDS